MVTVADKPLFLVIKKTRAEVWPETQRTKCKISARQNLPSCLDLIENKEEKEKEERKKELQLFYKTIIERKNKRKGAHTN